MLLLKVTFAMSVTIEEGIEIEYRLLDCQPEVDAPVRRFISVRGSCDVIEWIRLKLVLCRCRQLQTFAAALRFVYLLKTRVSFLLCRLKNDVRRRSGCRQYACSCYIRVLGCVPHARSAASVQRTC